MSTHPPSHPRKMKAWTYGLLWTLAFLPRLVLSITYFHQPVALDDMFQYDMLARSIIKGNGYRWYGEEDLKTLRPYYAQFFDVDGVDVPKKGLKTAFRAPGYPLFLGGIYRLVPGETRFGWARIAQAALTALLAPLTAAIAISQGMKEKIAKISGVGMALYPILLFYPLALASENTFIPLLAAGFLLLLNARPKGTLTPILASAFLLGLCTLTRSVIAPFLFLSAGWLWWVKGIKLKRAAIFLIVALGLCLPWAIRNTAFMGKLTFLETNLGYNLFVSYHPQGDGGFVSEVAIKPLKYLDDRVRDEHTTRKALQFIKEDPWEALKRVSRKMAFFFGVEDREMIYFYGNGFFGNIPQPGRLILYLLLILPWTLTLFLTPLGMLSHDHRARNALTLGLLIVYAVPHFLIMAEPRFHLALVPMLLPYAAYAWSKRREIVPRLASRKWSDPQKIALSLSWGLIIILLVWNFSTHWQTLLEIMGSGGHQLRLPY